MRQIIFFLTGAVIGAGGALLWLQKDYKKKLEALENRMNEQAEAAEKDENEGKEDKDESENGDEDPDLRNKNDGKRVLIGKTDLYGYTNYTTKEGLERENEDRKRENYAKNDEKMRDYASLYPENVTKSGAKSDALEDKSDAFDPGGPTDDDNFGPPYEISEFEYIDNPWNYQKREIKYYVENDIFTDENDECVTFLAQCVTFENQKWRIEIEKTRPEKLWVKNDQISTLYEIWVVYDAYSED